jgi:WD40 repeat protein
MARIFLSHSSVDEREAVALNKWLTDNGWDDIFLDIDPQRGLAAGERWQEALRQAADRCEAVIFIVSPAWAKSKWCLAEFLLAKSLHKQIFGVVLKDIPIGELPTEMTSEWQLCHLIGTGPTEIIQFRHRDTNDSIAFLTEGLGRLKTGLKKAGLSADFFPWPPKDEPHRSPFRGLEPLDFEDAAVFFGRDLEILRGLDALRGLRDNPATRLFVILAASGTGKSSFLRAGLLPRLARDDRHFLPLGVVRPETAPISGDRGLAQVLAHTMKQLDVPGSNPGDLKPRLSAGAGEFASILSSIQEAARVRFVSGDDQSSSPAPTLVLPVDQAEELFNADAGPEARKFLGLIAELLRDAQSPAGTSSPAVSVIVAFTIRSDRYEPLQTAPELAGLQTTVFDDLKPMSATRFREVITGPAERASTAAARLEIKPDLVDRLVEDCATGADTLPLLSLTLERLYHDYGSDGDLRLDEYLGLGGMGNIINDKIEKVLDPDSEKRKQQLVLLRTAFIPWLVTINPQNDEPMRRLARRSDLPVDSLPLVDALAENRLLTRDQRHGETVIEVAHETLLRQWGALAGWLQDERAALKEADALERQSREWKESNFDESWLWGGQRLQDALALAGRLGFRKRLEGCSEFLERSRKQQEERDAEKLRVQTEKLKAAEELAAVQAAARLQAEQAAARAKRQFKIAVALGLVAAAGALVALLSYDRASRDRKAAQKSEQTATDALSKAERNAILSQSEALVGEVRQARDARPVQSLLLASAAVETTRRRLADKTVLPSAHQTLRDALAGIGGRALVGHEQSVGSVAFSPDNRWVVTGSQDKTARLWDLEAADPISQLPIVLKGHGSAVTAVGFSPDNRWVVTVDTTARLWDLKAADPAAQPRVLKGHGGAVTAVAFSPDNHWVVTGSVDTTARLWDLETADPTAQPLVLKGHGSAVIAVAFSPDNHWVVTGSVDTTARLWDLKAADPAAQPVLLKGHEAHVSAVAFSPDNRWIVTGSWDKTARLWDLKAADPAAQPLVLKGHEDAVKAVAFSSDNRWVVTGSDDNTARLWDLKAADPATQPLVLKGKAGLVRAAAFSPDSHWVATWGWDKTARLWDLKAADPTAQPLVLKGHEREVNAVAFSRDNHWVVTGSGDTTARLWDLKAADPAVQPVLLKGHEAQVNAVAFSRDNRWIVTGSWDKTARVWDLNAADPAAQPLVLQGHEHSVYSVAFSSDNRWVVTGSGDTTARLWDLKAPDPAAHPLVLKGDDRVFAVALSPDSRWIVTAGMSTTAYLWDLKVAGPAARPLVLKGHKEEVTGVAFSPDNRWVVTGSDDKTARLWDLKAADPTAQPIVLKGHESEVNAVAFSADNLWVVTGSYDTTARLWDLKAANPAAQPVVLKGHENAVNAVAFSADNLWVVTGSSDRTARLWDLKAADPAAQPVVLKGHEGSVRAVAFSSDNRWVVTGSGDNTARLWDLKAADPTAQPLVLKGHEGVVNAVAFSPDGRWVVTGSEDKTARLWLLQIEDLLALARRTAGRNLSTDEWHTFLPGQPYFEVFPGLPIPKK